MLKVINLKRAWVECSIRYHMLPLQTIYYRYLKSHNFFTLIISGKFYTICIGKSSSKMSY